MPAEKVRLRIGNLAKAVLVTGQAYQDPKDALNEFVSNAADEYAESDRRGERIRIVLRRKGQRPLIAIEDNGRGLSKDRLRDLARNLFESSKVGDARTLGEKAIGLLAFQQLGGRCDVVSRTVDSDETWALRLTRGSATASLDLERRKPRTTAGTTVFLSDLDPDVIRVLTTRKVVDYLRTRRGAAIASGDYEIEVIEGRTAELVTPDRPDGIRLDLPARPTLWGRIEFNLFVAPNDGSRRRVAAVGRAGTTIIDDISELDEFNGEPWASDQIAGQSSSKVFSNRRDGAQYCVIATPFPSSLTQFEPWSQRSMRRSRELVAKLTRPRPTESPIRSARYSTRFCANSVTSTTPCERQRAQARAKVASSPANAGH